MRYGRGKFPFTITVSGGGGGGGSSSSCGDRCEIGVINGARSHASSGGDGNLNSVTRHGLLRRRRPPPLRPFRSLWKFCKPPARSQAEGGGGPARPTSDRGDKFG